MGVPTGSVTQTKFEFTKRALVLEAFLVVRIWNTQDSQGQIPALAFRKNSLKPFKVYPEGAALLLVERTWHT